MRILFSCLFVVLWLVAPAMAEGPAKNVILFGWDGAQRNHVHECLERGELPTLKKLSEEGGLVAIDVITGATDTKAGWSQILTGYHPDITGVYSNGNFHDIPEGFSVFERLKKQFGAEDFVCVAVIGKSGHCGEIRPPTRKPLDQQAQPAEPPKKKEGRKQPGAGKPQQGTVIEENGVKYLVFGGSPYYTMHKICDVWEYGLTQDEKVGTRAMALLEKYKDKPFFFFVHFAEVDHSGHKHGENSKEYNDALISNDSWTGKILDKLKELGLYDKTLVYVTADHGFDEGGSGHGYAPFVFLGTNDPRVKRDGMRQDVAPTILAAFGLDLTKFEPALSGEPLTAAATKPVQQAPEKKAGARPQKANAGKKKAAPAKKKAA